MGGSEGELDGIAESGGNSSHADNIPNWDGELARQEDEEWDGDCGDEKLRDLPTEEVGGWGMSILHLEA